MTNEYGRIHTDGSRSGGQPKEKYRQIGIGLINEYRQQRGFEPTDYLAIDTPQASAFIRSIQLHEYTKQELRDVKQELSDFRQEVSDAVLEYYGGYHNASGEPLERFIITKPPTVLFVTDPLAKAMAEIGVMPNAGGLRDALDALGFEIREKANDQ